MHSEAKSGRRLEVAVIGAGPSGLVATKELLEEGHRVVCFEDAAQEGGLFEPGHGVSYPDLKLTVSQYFMAFSSLPPPLEEARDYWSREQYLSYLRRFVAVFGLRDHLRFRTNVSDVTPAGDRFAVHWESEGQGGCETFDAVAVCRGAFRSQSPRWPAVEGLRSFSGRVVHASAYDGPSSFAGQRVVCVGLGETSSDVTTQIAAVAAKCWLSIRRRSWLVSRYPGGREFTNDAYSARMRHWNPGNALGSSGERLRQRWLSDLEAENLAPRDRFILEWNCQAPTAGHGSAQKNCGFVDSVLDGKIEVIHHGVTRVDGHTVHFADGSSVQADALVLCTGYEEGAAPVPPGWFGVDRIDDVRSLYKHAFHPQLRDKVAFIGWARPAEGGAPACAEMLARYFSLLCSGKRTLPPPVELAAKIAANRASEEADLWAQPYMRTLVRYTTFMDEVADLIGCAPRMEDYLDEPELLFKLLCGSNIAACYRLRGPQALPELARQVILRLPVAHPSSAIRESLPRLLNLIYEPQLAARMWSICEPFADSART
jgi:cation diffusion facilitator CzcD-associated flavoprotein CzcO